MLKKARLFLVIAVILSFLYPMRYCFALSDPHIVVEEEVWLLDKQSGSRLFILPKTYYAKIDTMDDDFYYVTFNGISGKVERNLVSTVGYHAQAAGTMQEMRIHPKFSDFNTIALKSSMDASSEDIIMPVSESFIFLGEYPLSEKWYYVRYNDKIGYIRASRTTVPDIQIPDFVPEKPDTQPVQPPQDLGKKESFFKNPSFLRIIIVAG
ncbi:MAG TPA: hypothetical protein GXZ42_05745, partial [Clostridiales bacterium]|nr:hypothetical protein [Clostridiales bacterium]